MKKIPILIIALMLLPVFGALLQADGNPSVNAYSPNVVTFAKYLDDKDVQYSGEPFQFHYFVTSHELTDETSWTSIDVGTGYDWYVDIPYCTSNCYPERPFWYETHSYGITVHDGYAQAYYVIYYDGSVYDDYFFYDNDSIHVNTSAPDVDALEFQGSIFFGDSDYVYGMSDLSETKTLGWEYDKDNDTGGYSAIEIGELIFMDGLLGMVPRIDDEVFRIPIIENLVRLGLGAPYLLIHAGYALIRNLLGISDPEPDITYTEDYYTIGDWEQSGSNYYYVISENPFWGSRIKYDSVTEYYYLQTYRFWIWISVPTTFISDEVMSNYKDDTNNFE